MFCLNPWAMILTYLRILRFVTFLIDRHVLDTFHPLDRSNYEMCWYKVEQVLRCMGVVSLLIERNVVVVFEYQLMLLDSLWLS